VAAVLSGKLARDPIPQPWSNASTLCSKKEATKLLAITLSKLTDFQNSFTAEKRKKYPTKSRNIFHHTLGMFSHYFGKFNSSNLLQITTEEFKSISYLTKMKRLCCHTVEWR